LKTWRTPHEPWPEEPWEREIHFWRRFLTLQGDRWPEDYARRIDPEAAVEIPVLLRCIEELDQPTVEVLDVGAGPLTRLGMQANGTRVHITPVDPLAEAYDALLAELRITPLVRTIPGTGEQLLEQFGPGRFDIAFANNAVDHSSDAKRCIDNMLQVVRPGGMVGLSHRAREGERQGYSGLHQWNFDEQDGEFVIWQRDGDPIDVTSPLRATGHDVKCEVAGDLVTVAIRTPMAA
jgi:SAM-dependent methyltransferase